MTNEERIKRANTILTERVNKAMDEFFERVKDIHPSEYYSIIVDGLLSEKAMEDFYNWYNEEHPQKQVKFTFVSKTMEEFFNELNEKEESGP